MLTKPQVDLLSYYGDDIQNILDALIDAQNEIESLKQKINSHVCV